VAVGLAQRGAETTAVDISRRAVVATRLNARRNGVRVDARRGYLFEPVAEDRFDLITCNPPYVPDVDAPATGVARAWRAGPDGRRFIAALAAGAAHHLRSGGALLVVHSSLIGEGATLEALAHHGLLAEVVARRTGPLGPLMRAQQHAGRIDPDIDHEDLLVFAATRPRAGGRR
jgi:release factor glutamine methyltransferase